MNAEQQRLLHNLVTIGTISEIDADKGLLRFTIGDNETNWIAIPSLWAGQVSVWRCPEKGEQFLLISPSGDFNNAIPVMAIYSDKHPRPSKIQEEIRVRYNDNDFLSINVADSKLHLTISDITHTAKTQITLDTPSVTITGDLQVDGAVHCDTTITADTEVTANGINLTTHTHKGVKSGSSNTGKPS